METSASFEARYAPLLYPTNQVKYSEGDCEAAAGKFFGRFVEFRAGRSTI